MFLVAHQSVDDSSLKGKAVHRKATMNAGLLHIGDASGTCQDAWQGVMMPEWLHL
jgi:hypothetical protein